MVFHLMNSGAYILTPKGSWCQDVIILYIYYMVYMVSLIFPGFVWCLFLSYGSDLSRNSQ